MRKLLLLALALCLMLHPLCARAAAPLDPEAEASLTLLYQNNGAVFPEVTVGIYRVAEALPSGEFRLIEPFSGYPVNIQNIMAQEQWTNIANTLNAYIVADGVKADAQAVTDPEGLAKFEKLKTGLYFVEQVVAEQGSGRLSRFAGSAYDGTLWSSAARIIPSSLASATKSIRARRSPLRI